ncbi:MAG: glycosyltransferase family 2 protein [Alphaproteobacteria bacterium]
MTEVSISIVLLNYNHGRFLTDALASLCASLEPDDEVLAFDDASTDDSVETYREFAAKVPQLRLCLKERNQGVIACMNEGLRKVQHDYVYFAASDDRVEPGFLPAMRALLRAHPGAGLTSCRCRLIDESGRALGLLPTPKVRDVPGFLDPSGVAKAFLEDDNWLVGASTIYRRKPLLDAGAFLPELGSFCDGFASRVVALRHGACFSPDALTNWRRMEEGYSSSEAANMERMTRICDTTLTLMATTYADCFPLEYRERWRGRWLFGTRCRSWRQQQKGHAGVEGPLRGAWLILKAVVVSGALFLRYRPRDLMPVLKRRLAYLVGAA